MECTDDVRYAMIGNGYCNDETNNADCNYDGGDCCGACVVKEFCEECQCLGNVTGSDGISGESVQKYSTVKQTRLKRLILGLHRNG